MSDDPRKKLPSSSSLERIALCPASYQMSLLAKDCEEETTYAASGDRIHRRLSGEKVELSEDEKDVWQACIRGRDEALDNLFPFGWQETIKEQRIWLKDNAGNPVFSGQFDHVAVCGDEAAIIDYKTGVMPVEHPRTNLQLQSYAVLLLDEHPELKSISVVVVQPLAGGVSHHTFSRDDLRIIKAKIMHILEQANAEAPPIIPGRKQCQYCRASGQCKESVAVATSFAGLSSLTYTPDEAGQILHKVKLAKKTIEKIEEFFRRELMNNPKAVTGWRLNSGSARREVTDPDKIVAYLRNLGIVDPGFDVQTKKVMSITDIRRAIRKHDKKIKDEDIDKLLDGALSDAIKTTRTKPQLKEDKQ